MFTRAIKLYLVFFTLIAGYLGYATLYGITFWEDQPERNTTYIRNSHSHGGYGSSYHHK